MNGGQAEFALKGTEANLPVVCSGPLPDQLGERAEVVVEGRLDECGVLRGEKVLTRCASKYRSQEGAQRSPDGATVQTEGGP